MHNMAVTIVNRTIIAPISKVILRKPPSYSILGNKIPATPPTAAEIILTDPLPNKSEDTECQKFNR